VGSESVLERSAVAAVDRGDDVVVTACLTCMASAVGCVCCVVCLDFAAPCVDGDTEVFVDSVAVARNVAVAGSVTRSGDKKLVPVRVLAVAVAYGVAAAAMGVAESPVAPELEWWRFSSPAPTLVSSPLLVPVPSSSSPAQREHGPVVLSAVSSQQRLFLESDPLHSTSRCGCSNKRGSCRRTCCRLVWSRHTGRELA